MSETTQIPSAEELARRNAEAWAAKDAENGTVRQTPTMEQITANTDTRTTGQKIGDWGKVFGKGLSEVPELYRENPELLWKEVKQGVAEGVVGTGALIVDGITFIAYDNLINPLYNDTFGLAFNTAETLLGGDTNWNLPQRSGWDAVSQYSVGAIKIAKPIKDTMEIMVDGKPTEVENPHADAQRALRTSSMLVVDAVMVPVTAPMGGGVLNVVRAGKVFEGGAAAIKTYDRVKKVTRMQDAIELTGKANSKIKKVDDIAKEMAEEAAKLGGKEGDAMLAKANELAETAKDVKTGKIRYKTTEDGSKTDKLLHKAQKEYDEAEAIAKRNQTRTWSESAPDKAESIITGKPVSEIRGGASTRQDMADYLTDRVTAVNPQEFGARFKASIPTIDTTPGLSLKQRITTRGTPAQNVRKTEAAIERLGDNATASLLNKNSKVIGKVQDELDTVNTLAQRIGIKNGFSLDEAMRLPFTNKLDDMLYGERILHSYQSGAYRTFHAVDPIENPTFEILAVAGVFGWQTLVFEREKETKALGDDSAIKGGTGVDVDRARTIREEEEAREKQMPFNKHSGADAQKAEKDLANDTTLNGKDIKSNKEHYNGVSSGLQTGNDARPEDTPEAKDMEKFLEFSSPVMEQ